MSKPCIYLDYHASTPVDDRVLDVMLPYFTRVFGNAASRSHHFGWQADSAVGRARLEVAALIGAGSPREIVFTSGATESNNLALRGVLEAAGLREDRAAELHIITSAIEHPCILETAGRLQSQGATWTVVGVNAEGLVCPQEIEAAIRPETVLISIMSVNNEVGTIQPIAEIGRIAKKHGVLFHTDAAQAAGRIEIDVDRDAIDLLSLSAHKLYGPKGVGALYVRRFPERVQLTRQIEGGGHEFGMRSGTLNVPGIVGFGKAAQLAAQGLSADATHLAELRDELLSRLRAQLSELQVHGCLHNRVAGNLNLSFAGVSGEALLNAVPQLAFSVGSACASGKPEVSHVLAAMGVSKQQARCAVRIGLGRFTTRADVIDAAQAIAAAVTRLRRVLRYPQPRVSGGESAHA